VGVALVEIVAALERYRVYVLDAPPWYDDAGREALDAAFRMVERDGRATPAAVRLLARLLMLDPEPTVGSAEIVRRLDFTRRVGQLSVTAAAKGVEDTALYRYVPLVVRNEVGSEPTSPRSAPARFDAANESRCRRWPSGLLSTSTHDTKRSADVRSRLAVLTEIPDEWLDRVRRWRRLTASHRSSLGGRWVPDANVEYLFYQTAVGIWPVGASPVTDVRSRIESYVLKAIREAKTHTSWARPNPDYEDAVRTFVVGALDPAGELVADLAPFARRVAAAGRWNALGRTLVHLTAPGIPDIYQGDELWAFLLVDPDNRTPVDFAGRGALLDELERRFGSDGSERQALLDELVAAPEDGRIKLHTIHRALGFRRAHGPLFARGSYLHLSVEGSAASHVVSYARQHGDDWSLTVAPRLSLGLTGGRGLPPIGHDVWTDTAVILPEAARGRTWRSVLTGDIVGKHGGRGAMLRVAEIFRRFPVALLAPRA
jgi:(1->4)-alpha-D-glucan 1-alpha-D-glucosylmutase